MRCVCYTRDTSREGHEAAIQLQNIEAWALEHDAKIEERYTDSYDSLYDFRRMIQDGVDRRYDKILLDSIYACGENLNQAEQVLLDTFFPFSVHFTCVDDGFDSTAQTKSELTAYFEEKRVQSNSKDLARCRQKRYELPMTGRDVRYGYKLSENGRYLVPDEVTAPVVKEIFMLFKTGKNCIEIAEQMNEEGHIVPLKYKLDAVNCVKDQEYSWKYRAVRQILTNPIYIGQGIKRVNGQDMVLDVEPLISMEDFDKAQDYFKEKKKNHVKRHGAASKDNAFSNRIFDSKTGKRLLFMEVPETKQKVFIAWKPLCYMTIADRAHNLPYYELENIVMERLRAEKALAEKVKTRMTDCDAEVERNLNVLRNKASHLFWGMETMVRNGQTESLTDEAFTQVMKEEHLIRMAFTPQNPWVEKFSGLELGEHLTAEQVKSTVAQIRVTDLKDVEITLQESEWKQMLPKEWMEGE